jgi:hypothetical protein
MPCNASYTGFIFGKVFHMYYIVICILYALLCRQNFILVKSGCYIVGHTFLQAPSCHGVVGAPVHLPRESRCVGLICTADRWGWSPQAAGAAPVACGIELFTTFGMSCMVLGMVYKWPSLFLLGSINIGVLGINSFIRSIHSLLRVRVAVPFLAFAFSAALAFAP